MPSDERVDANELVDILREAVDARNGWKRILSTPKISPCGSGFVPIRHRATTEHHSELRGVFELAREPDPSGPSKQA
jgi:hypothetical protein